VTTPTDCSVLYVKPGASNAGDGCSPAAALGSPQAAITKISGKTKEIWLCAGSFTTAPLVLSSPVSLRGSRNCTSWAPPAAGATPTTIVVANAAGPALVVSGATIKRDTFIEDLQLNGATAVSQSTGLTIEDGASPTVRRNLLAGGGAAGPDFPSVGVFVTSGASPRLERNTIGASFGTATAYTIASLGLYIGASAGLLEVEGNTIRGGPGSIGGSGVGSAGVYIEQSTRPLRGTTALRDNEIAADTGVDTKNKTELLAAGVVLDDTLPARTDLEIVGGSISGGTADHSGTPAAGVYPSAVGVYASNHKALLVDRVRIYAGDASEVRGVSIGVSLNGAGTAEIRSSILHGGGALAPTPSPRAIESRQKGTLTLTGSTLLSGLTRNVPGATYFSGTGMYLEQPGKLVFRSNFFVMQSGYVGAIQIGGACLPPPGSTLVANAFLSAAPNHMILEMDDSAGCSHFDNIMTVAASRFAVQSGNVRGAPDPKAAAEIDLACSGESACLAKIVAGLSPSGAGFTETLDLTSDGLRPIDCRLVHGGLFVSEAPVDVLGVSRGMSGSTIGALEVAPSSSCP
jgi:hypothetical protein